MNREQENVENNNSKHCKIVNIKGCVVHKN